MTDLTIASSPLPDRMRYAEALAQSQLLPEAFRNKPANALVAIEYGNALGIAPIVALSEINVISGTPSLSASLMAALARQAGHKVRVTGTAESATAVVVRSDDPDYEHTATWDKQKAVDAGLWGRGHWRKDPGTMLRWRAISEAVRFACSEVLGGIKYTPEEVAEFSEAVQPVSTPGRQVSAPVSDRSGMARLRAAVHVEEPAAAEGDVVDAEVMASPEQRNAVIVALAADGVPEDPASILAALSERVGREISHTRDLTADEAEQILLNLGGAA